MKADQSKERVTIAGDLKPEVRVFNAESGEVIFRGNVIHGKSRYEGVPLVRLTIEAFDGGYPTVDDEFFRPIPYLKPIRAFQQFFVKELEKLLTSSPLPPLIEAGLRRYQLVMETFSEKSALIRQAKSAVNTLDAKRPGPDAEKKARAVLQAMGCISNADVPFEGGIELILVYQTILEKKRKSVLTSADLREIDRIDTILSAFDDPVYKGALEHLRERAKK